MATVQYGEITAATDGALISIVMPLLHTKLLAAGWTLEYVDADAIGSGSAETPAWDKAPVTNTDAGVAVYRMPANGAFTRWYARIRPGWAANTNRPHIRGVTVGSGHAGDGVLTGSTSEIVPSIANAQTDNRQVYVAASEDGFYLNWYAGSSTDATTHVERIRLMDESVQDEVIAFNRFNNFQSAFLSASLGGSNLDFTSAMSLQTQSSSSVGVNPDAQWAMSLYADTWLFVGPFWPIGDPLTGLPRLWRIAPAMNVAAGTTIQVDVDGGLKTYKVASTPWSNQVGMLVVATE